MYSCLLKFGVLSLWPLAMPHNSEEAHCRGPLGRASLLETLEDMLRKAPGTDVCLPIGASFVRGPGIRRRAFTGDFE